MPVTEKTWEVPLGRTGLFARLTWKRDGQQEISISDSVQVYAEIALPAVGAQESKLAQALRFGNRVMVWGEYLRYGWGEPLTGPLTRQQPGYRERHDWFSAATWAEAAAAAERSMAEALEPLLAALAAREQALINAEGPEEKKLGTRQIERAGTTNRELR
jgi:hypothetical protein